ncbi:hypothetical protein PG984_001989 [Apiospora sp. TS-2023a]
MSSTSLLLTMPLEVLLSISYYLTTTDYCNLRQSCTHIEASLHSSFAKEYFSKRQFILTEFSLQALVDISRSKFSPYLTHIILAVERPQYSDHINLTSFSRDLEMLADAFSNLPNLETIGMRDFNSRTRFRDHLSGLEWRSYGANTYERDTGLALARPSSPGPFGPAPLSLDNNWPLYEARLFIGLLQALGKSGSHPKRFEVILRSIGLYDMAFNLPRFSESIIDPVLARLDTLFLDLSEDHNSAMTRSGPDQAPSNCTNYFLRGFLSRLPALSSLRVNFAMSDHRKTCDFLSWLASPLPLPGSVQGANDDDDGRDFAGLSPPPPVAFSSLKQLDLGKASISIDVLICLVNKFQPSLQGLSFYKVTLLKGAEVSDSSAKVNLWTKALRHLIKSSVALKSLRVDTVYQDHTHQTLHIQFKETARPRSRTLSWWRGQDKENGLKDMANNMVIEWPESDDESMDDEDSVDELDDDEDEDEDE